MSAAKKSSRWSGCARCLKTWVLVALKRTSKAGTLFLKQANRPRVFPQQKSAALWSGDFGFDVQVVTKSAKEMADIVKRNPFVKDKAIDQTKLHVTFLSDDPPKNAAELIQPLAVGEEQIRIAGRAVYLYCPNSYGNTKLNNNAIEKKLSCGATTRNWNTTKTLLEMAKE